VTFAELKVPSLFCDKDQPESGTYVKTEAIYSKYGDDIYNAVSLYDGEFYWFFADHEVQEYGYAVFKTL
jgi:hypothetical protein